MNLLDEPITAAERAEWARRDAEWKALQVQWAIEDGLIPAPRPTGPTRAFTFDE